MDLIELTRQEQMLAGVTCNMKEICDRYDLRHDNAMRDFKSELKKLSNEQKEKVTPHFEVMPYSAPNGRRLKTIEMSAKVAVWFFTKYDTQLRYSIVDYAFGKLTEDFSDHIALQAKQIQKLEADKFNDYSDNYKSVSRFVKEKGLEITATELYDLLEDAGEVVSTEVVRIKREITENGDGVYSPKGTLLFPVETLEAIIADNK